MNYLSSDIYYLCHTSCLNILFIIYTIAHIFYSTVYGYENFSYSIVYGYENFCQNYINSPFTCPIFENTNASCPFNMHGHRVPDVILFICKEFKTMCCCFRLWHYSSTGVSWDHCQLISLFALPGLLLSIPL